MDLFRSLNKMSFVEGSVGLHRAVSGYISEAKKLPQWLGSQWSCDKGMPRNIEIKARLEDPERFQNQVYELTESLGTVFTQEDTFFKCSNGLLKLRVVNSDSAGELIFYQRAEQTGPKSSKYTRTPVSDSQSFKETLGLALGVIGVVRKQRRLYLHEQTRIHLDEVEDLGTFMELEVVMDESQSNEDGEKIAHKLMETLEIGEESLVALAYIDLLIQKKSDTIDKNGAVVQTE